MNKKVFLIIGIITIPYLLLFLNLRFIMTNASFYDKQYSLNGAYERFGKEKVQQETNNILSYYRYGTPITSEFFNEKEKAHLSDVKDLYGKARILFYVALMVWLICIFIASKHQKKTLLLYGSLLTMLVVGIVYIITITSFASAFTAFHNLVFDSNNWQLNPETDNLILLTPESFFIAFVASVIKNTAITSLIIGGSCLIGEKINKRNSYKA